jgi:hypothetical protein
LNGLTTTHEETTMIDTTATVEDNPGVRISAAELALTREKFAKLAARTAKRGFTGGLELDVTGPFEDSTVNEFTGIKTTTVFYRVKVTGEAPSYGGWKFLGRVDATASGKPIISSAPGVEEARFEGVQAGVCDHCGHNRARKTTYLVVNAETGEQKLVGSTCIKDFLGWQATPVFIYPEDVEEKMGGWGGGEPSWTPETVVATAWAAIKTFGYTRSGEAGATVGIVRSALRPYTKSDREIAAQLRPVADDAVAKANTVLDFIRSGDFSGGSSYVTNLKTLVDEQYVTGQFLGFLASAPQAWIRHLETADERAAKEAQWAAERAARDAEKTGSQHLGAIGEKVTFKGSIISIRWQHDDYTGGSKPIYKIRTTDGYKLAWFASSADLGEQEGVEIWLQAKVKKHDEFNGTKETTISHAVRMNPDTNKPFSSRITNKHYQNEWVGDARVYEHDTPHPDCEVCYSVAHDEA